MGTLLTLLTLGVLFVDDYTNQWYPFLFLLLAVLGLVAAHELRTMLETKYRPTAWLCYGSVLLLVVANWPAHLWTWDHKFLVDPWHWILAALAVIVLGTLIEAMIRYEFDARQEGVYVLLQMAIVVFLSLYMGFLASFLAQLRWLKAHAVLALILAIFVPKCCDIGAYFTGRLLGKHRMTPRLSPNKTWQGLAGGLALAMAVAFGVNRFGPVIPPLFGNTDIGALAFGLTVGLAGVVGDLAESLIKRVCRQKDASQVVPGFGGVLDVVDSVVFAAPIVYAWLCWS